MNYLKYFSQFALVSGLSTSFTGQIIANTNDSFNISLTEHRAGYEKLMHYLKQSFMEELEESPSIR